MPKANIRKADKKRAPRSVHAARSTRSALNRAMALELRVSGKSIRAIALELRVSPTTAHDYITAQLAEVKDNSAGNREKLRDIERARLERVLCQVLPFIENEVLTIESQRGENLVTVERFQAVMKGADTVTKISARLSALDGLDAPVKQEHGLPGDFETASKIRARLAARKKE